MPKRLTLTDRMRRRIIEAGAHGDATQREIARNLGVSQMTVWKVLREAAQEAKN